MNLAKTTKEVDESEKLRAELVAVEEVRKLRPKKFPTQMQGPP